MTKEKIMDCQYKVKNFAVNNKIVGIRLNVLYWEQIELVARKQGTTLKQWVHEKLIENTGKTNNLTEMLKVELLNEMSCLIVDLGIQLQETRDEKQEIEQAFIKKHLLNKQDERVYRAAI